MKKRSRQLWGWVRLAGALAVLVVLGVRLGADAFTNGVRAVGGGSVALALAIGGITTLFSAWRWRSVAARLGLAIPLPRAVADYYRALLINAVLPAGVLGDVHRAVEHGRAVGDFKRSARAVVGERCAGQVVLAVLAVLVLIARPVDVPGVPGREVLAAGLLLGVGGIVAGVVWSRWVRELLTWSVVACSLLITAGHVALFVVAARVAGVDAPVDRLIPVSLLALLVMAIPVNVGGFGPREAFLAIAFGATGLGDAAMGVTTAVVYGVLALAASSPGIVILLRQRRQVRGETGHQRRDQSPALVG